MPSRPRVALDLDGVVYRSEAWRGPHYFGPLIPGAVEFARRIGEVADIVVHTCRLTPDPETGPDPDHLARIVEDQLRRDRVPFDRLHVGLGKPSAKAYVDDRAVACRPADDRFSQALWYNSAINEIEKLLGRTCG